MAVSIKDIARLAGVSHSTVSRALRQSPLIPAQTTDRIKKIAEEQGYRASAIARSLVTRKTRAIGVVVTSIADPFNGAVVDGIEQAANEQGYSVILATSQANPDRELSVVRSFAERRVDGILVASSRVGALYMPMLAELKIPVLLLNNQGDSTQVHSISIDDEAGGGLAGQHLVALGHKRVAYVGDRFGYYSDTARFAGFRGALTNFDDRWKFAGDGRPEGGRAAAQQMLGLNDKPTGIFCYNDATALGFLAELKAHGYQIPRDFSVIGFDDIDFAALTNPALTTVAQPRREMGLQAANMLLTEIAGAAVVKTTTLTPRLIVRESTAPCVE